MGTNVTVSMISKAICAAAHATLSQRTISDINYKASVHFAIHLSLMLKEIMTSMSTPFYIGGRVQGFSQADSTQGTWSVFSSPSCLPIAVESAPQESFVLLLPTKRPVPFHNTCSI